MKEPDATSRQTTRDQVRVRLQSLRSSSNFGGMLGFAEIVGLAASALVLIVVVVSYLYFLVPARSQRELLQRERERLQTQLRNSQEVARQGLSTDATVKNLIQSLDEFENTRLVGRNNGRMSLYEELNQVIRKNGLRNTSGPTYTTLEPVGMKSTAGAAKTTSTKWQSVYPGIAISLTVEGPYQNLRRFVRDIEVSSQFIIINSIELERATEVNTAVSADGGAAGSRGAMVSLRLDMTTYFQRVAQEESNLAN